MGSHPHFLRPAQGLAVGCLVAALACGQTSRNAGQGGGAGSVTSTGGGSGQVPAGGGTLAAGGNAPDDVKVGRCVFEDPNVAQLVRYRILQADGLDGPVDGSVGIEAVTSLDVSQPFGALGGIECLENLEELRLGVYEPGAPLVELSALAGLSRLRALWLYGPFVIDGMFGRLALEKLDLAGVALHDLAVVAKEPGIRDLGLTDVPLTSLAGIEALSELSTLRIENARISSLVPLGSSAALQKLELRDLPTLSSLTGLEPHTSLLNLLATNVPLQSLVPLAKAARLESLNVWTSALTGLEGLENKPALKSVVVTDGRLNDIAPLAGLPLLSYVSLAGNQIADLTPLSSCPSLTSLDASKNSITSLAPVAAMTTLGSLALDDNLLTAIDVDLPDSLTSLYISRNAITTLEPLATHAVQNLSISSNPLVSLAPLFDLPALVSLTANDVGASDVTEFPLGQLQGLVAQDNHIASVAPLSGLTNLSVDLSGNDIVSLPPDFLGLATVCGGLTLLDNPLDAPARERLTWLCSQGGASYRWDGGECDKCPRV